MNIEQLTMPVETLRAVTSEVLRSVPIPDAHAAWVSEGLIEADLRGVPSHGSVRLEAYVNGWRASNLNPSPEMRTARRRATVTLLDADGALGIVAGREAMRLAIQSAHEFGIGIVGVHNSNHSGMLAQHVIPAADAGMIGYFVSNGPPVLAPWGGRDATLSNNPFAYAIPAAIEPHIVVDMACSSSARGKIRLAALQHKPIPDDWALGPDGERTCDAHAAMEGALLPFGQHKGYSLAVVNEVLAAVLPGAQLSAAISTAFLKENADTMDHWGAGHLAMAVDLAAFGDPDELRKRVDDAIAVIRSSRPAAAADGVLMPGELEARLRARRLEDGVPLSPLTVAALERACSATGVAWAP